MPRFADFSPRPRRSAHAAGPAESPTVAPAEARDELERLRRQAAQSQTLATVAAHFTLATDLAETLCHVSEHVVRATGALAADVVIPVQTEGVPTRSWVFGGHGHPPEFLETCERVMREGARSPLTITMDVQETQVVPGARKAIASLKEWAPLVHLLEQAEWDIMVTVPVIYRGRSIGVLDAYFRPDDEPGEETLSFLRAIADQAAVGVENARLFEDTQRSAREYATLAGIAADLTLDRPMDEAIRAICEGVVRGTGAVGAQISLLNEENGRLETFEGAGLPPGYLEAARGLEAAWTLGRRRLISQGRPIVLGKLQETLGPIPDAAALIPYFRQMDANSAAILPLFARGGPLGTLSLFFQPPEAPDADSLRFFSGVANQVTAAIDNKRLYEKMRHAARESSALAAIAANITLGQPVRSTLDTVANSVVLATSAITCTVSIADPLTGEMVMSGSAGVPDGFVEVARVVADRPESRRNQAIATGEPVIQHGVRAALLADPAFEKLWDQIREAPWDTVVSLPVKYGARYVGVLQVGYEAGAEPSSDEWKLLSAIADQLAVAIENARLYMRSESNARQNSALAEIARNVTLDQPMRTTLAAISRNVVAATTASGVALFLVDVDTDRIVMTGSHGLPATLLDKIERTIPASAGFTREAFSDGSQIFVPDARRKMLANPVFASIYEDLQAEEWEHIQVVPVVYRGKAVGAIYATYPAGAEEPAMEERELLSAIANQAAVAIENVRLYQEAEARTRELTSLLDLARAAGSTLEMQPLIDTILARIREVVPCAGVSIATFDDDGYITLIGQNTDEDIRDSLAVRVRHGEGTPLGERLHSGRAVIVEDLAGDAPEAAALRAKVANSDPAVWGRIRSWMAVPLMSKGRSIGALFFNDRTPGRFGDRQAELALAFAAQATAALENARLFEEQERRVGELEALTTIAASLTMVQPLETTLETLVRSVVGSTNAVACSVNLLDPESGAITYFTGYGLPEGYGDGILEVYQDPWARRRFFDFNSDPEGRPFRTHRQRLLESELFRPVHAILEQAPFDAFVQTSLRYKGRGVGALNAYFAPGYEPDERDINLLRAIADQAAVAVESSRLFADAQRRAREQAALAAIASALSYERPLPELLDTLAETVVQQTGIPAAAVVFFGEEPGAIVTGSSGLPDGYMQAVRESRRNHSEVWRDLDAATAVTVIEHARDFLRTQAAYAPLRAFADRVDWDCVVYVPFVYRDRTRGMLNLYLEQGEAPPREDLDFYQSIADRASAAIESAGLFADIERRAREQAALAAISSALTYDRPLAEVLDILAENVVAHTDAVASAVVVYKDRSTPVAVGQCGLPKGYLAAIAEARERDPEFWDSIEGGDDVVVLVDAEKTFHSHEGWAPLRQFLGKIEWDSSVRIPFSFGESTRGMLNLFLPGREHPPAADIEFYRQIAIRASVAVDNARLFAEVQERTQQLTALYRADEELHRSLQLEDVLNALLELVVEMLGTDGAALQLWEPEDASPRLITAGFGTERGAAAVVASLARQGRDAFVRDALERIDNALIIEETEDDPRVQKDRTARLGIHSIIDIGLMASGEVFGKLTAYNLKRRVFTDDDRRLFTSLARRASLAIENARLFERAQERTRQLAALYQADEELHRSLQLDDVLGGLISTVNDTFHADGVAAVVWEADDARPRFIPSGPMSEEDKERVIASLVQLGRDEYVAVRTGVRAIEDSALSPPEVQARTYDVGVRALLEAPLRADGQVIGHVGVAYRAPRQFSAEEKRLLGALALRAEVAIDNARLYARAQSLAAIEERQRLARELHDSVSQALYGIALGARTARTLLDRDAEKAIEPVDYVLSLAEAGLAEMRALIFELRPESLAQEGIVAAIEKQVASTRARYGIAVEASLCEEPDIPIAAKEALYRVAQEALHNVVKHARASNVEIVLCGDENGTRLDLHDDGQGFDPNGDFPGHLGLRSMRERVTRLGGTFEIESAPGEGTSLHAYLPRS